MIFATVGSQLPFDRLIKTVDEYVIDQGFTPCLAQIGRSKKPPRHLSWTETLSPSQFAKQIADCKVIVSHAGMGTILTAFEFRKPIVVMPRRAKFGEHRNDHQLATVAQLKGHKGLYIAEDEKELKCQLARINRLSSDAQSSPYAGMEMIAAIRDFVRSERHEEKIHARTV